ncbi:MAG: hypothetical protein WBB93_04670, partial [Saprospiraceae bacterium]
MPRFTLFRRSFTPTFCSVLCFEGVLLRLSIIKFQPTSPHESYFNDFGIRLLQTIPCTDPYGID